MFWLVGGSGWVGRRGTWWVELLQVPVQAHALAGLDLGACCVGDHFWGEEAEHPQPLVGGVGGCGPVAPLVGEVVVGFGEGFGHGCLEVEVWLRGSRVVCEY